MYCTVEQCPEQSPGTRVIMLSMHANEEYVGRALDAGAMGYLLKGAEPAELELVLKAVMRGETYLSPSIAKHLVQDYLSHRKEKSHPLPDLTARQREVLQRIAEGCSTNDIANTLKLSVKTVDTHRSELMRRLDIHDARGSCATPSAPASCQQTPGAASRGVSVS